ncbi:hypothetical protein Pcinc_043246 [Petrolisthes cinctipes]|uniref:C-type lectin domain-containing protein n=1 Tax=Petrolisthes cinctipes TaxID=88211 RepID=A0AAE1BG49_PETCI|nr:hypothetical protein Pcinc_043246 [Petrolisthes cinctipes]
MIRGELEHRGRKIEEETERERREEEGEGREESTVNNSCQQMQDHCTREIGLAASLRDLAVTVRVLLAKTTASAPCPYPYTRVVGECFYLHRKKLAWEKARRVCRGMGGDLAAPAHPHALQAHLADKYGPGYYWVGGRKVTQQTSEDESGDEEMWLWLTGRQLDPDNWLFSRPDNQQGDEDCLELVMSDYPGLFNDETCLVRQKFICQYWEGDEE